MPRLRPVPWLVLLELAMVAREHWGRLPDPDRRELARIVRKSKGLPTNLTDAERRELKRLVAGLDLPAAGKRLVPLGTKLRRPGWH
jgi:hypothetical protein